MINIEYKKVSEAISQNKMATWRNGYAEDCKSLYPGSIPGVASKKNLVLVTKKSKLSFLHSSVAQLVEQLTVNQLVAGSSPARGAKIRVSFLIFILGSKLFI